MAGGKITRISGGVNSLESDSWTVYTDEFNASSGGKSTFTADRGTNFGEPEALPPAGEYFVKGWWTDKNDQPIKEATIGDTIKFHIQTKGIEDGKKVNFTVYDWDHPFSDDKLTIWGQNGKEITTIIVQDNKGFVEWTTGEGCLKLLEETFEGDEIELFVKCQYKDETINLPYMESDYLALYEKEVLITVIIELPHSKETGWGAKGLAGHTGMAIGNKYFDYGPDYYTPIISEQKYDYDFNNDGDKGDILGVKREKIFNDKDQQIVEIGVLYDKNTKIRELDHTFAPGRSWWGEMIAKDLKIDVREVTLQQVLDFINLDCRLTNICGEVYKIEFYVKESEAKKMIEWWENRYQHLKLYSVYPWTGEQCTTAVKTAIQEAYPFRFGKNINRIQDDTQKPSGLLAELRKFKSSSKQNFGKQVKIKVIKNEATNFIQ